MTERWAPVPNFPNYQVSDLGRVRSIKSGVVLKATLCAGRPKVSLYRDGKKVNGAGWVHKLVAYAFLGPRPEGLVVRHKDGNAANCRWTNLRYGTQSENIMDSVEHGTQQHVRKTHCPYDHELRAPNLERLNTVNTRRCRACARARQYCARQRAKGVILDQTAIAARYYSAIMG